MEQSFRDVTGLDAPSVSRGSMDKIRSTWVEQYKERIMHVGKQRVPASRQVAFYKKATFVPVFILHIQDEADMRFRNVQLRYMGEFELPIPERTRTTKAQSNVVSLVTPHGGMEIPTEIEALGDKTAATLCTSFERVVRNIAEGVLPDITDGIVPLAAEEAVEAWFIHILVGDGIATNEAAARQLWACIQERGLGRGARYFLVVIKCGAHQVGLTAKGASCTRTHPGCVSACLSS